MLAFKIFSSFWNAAVLIFKQSSLFVFLCDFFQLLTQQVVFHLKSDKFNLTFSSRILLPFLFTIYLVNSFVIYFDIQQRSQTDSIVCAKFIHSLKYLFSVYYVPGTGLDMIVTDKCWEDTEVVSEVTQWESALMGFLMGRWEKQGGGKCVGRQPRAGSCVLLLHCATLTHAL